MPIEDRPFGPYGPMKNPSGSPKASSTVDAHRMVSGCCGVGSGTGAITPPSGAHWRQAPLLMKVGTGARPFTGIGVGTDGSRATATATGTMTRIAVCEVAEAFSAYAQSTPIS